MSADLGDWIATQRWFRSRSRTRTRTEIVDVIPVADVAVHLVRIGFSEGSDETYVVPLDGRGADATAAFADHVLAAMREGAELAGKHSALEVSKSKVDLSSLPQGEVGRAEQTNSTIRFGDRLIVKLYRAAVFGPNPEVEILRFLAEHAGDDLPTPRLVGEVSWVCDGSEAAVAMAQTFVKSRGDAWSTTLEALEKLVRDARGAPSEAALAAESARARKLGSRTATLHRALASPTKDPAFVPEPVDSLDAIADRVRSELKRMLERLRGATLAPDAARVAGTLLARAAALDARVRRVAGRPIACFQTRTHGDYHLGQVLVTPDDDLVIIDFEGEPARTLEERRSKGLAMRDVAGMLRSFDYAAAAARSSIGHSPWIDAWLRAVSASFLDGWRTGVVGSPVAPGDDDEASRLLDLFLVEKAVYEIGYELDHRPAWVGIPISGLLSRLSEEQPA